jgi:hypothetical protein
MKIGAMIKLPPEWIVDYQPAREKAIRWLGERYLLAREVKRLAHADESAAAGLVSRRRALSTASAAGK